MEKSCLTCKFGKPEMVEGRYYCSGEEGSHAQAITGRESTYSEDWWSGKYLPNGCGSYYQPRKETPTKMDKQTAINNHRHMWGWLSLNPGISKLTYLQKFLPGQDIESQCFLCQYNLDHNRDCTEGDDCILTWPNNASGESSCDDNGGLWYMWTGESNPTLRAELARQIRDLPERGKLREEDTVDIIAREEMLARKRRETAYKEMVEPTPTPPPPPKLTREDAIAKTREQWRWYARNPDEKKSAYFAEKGIAKEDRPKSLCYLCEWTNKDDIHETSPAGCGRHCPIDWPGGSCQAPNKAGLYVMFIHSDDYALRQSLAWLISRLPEKKE